MYTYIYIHGPSRERFLLFPENEGPIWHCNSIIYIHTYIYVCSCSTKLHCLSKKSHIGEYIIIYNSNIVLSTVNYTDAFCDKTSYIVVRPFLSQVVEVERQQRWRSGLLFNRGGPHIGRAYKQQTVQFKNKINRSKELQSGRVLLSLVQNVCLSSLTTQDCSPYHDS